MIKSIGFALDPTNVPSFLLDWELTKLCNLDCSYCATGIDGGHDNSTRHPPLDECLNTIDFMYEYVDLYMNRKKSSQRKVILNVYGGESIFHPHIVEILRACREKYKKYQHNWYLTITCTTNGIVGPAQWKKIVPLIDEFSLSYHAEILPKQEKQFLENVLYLQKENKKLKCIIMMHNQMSLFTKAEKIVDFCIENKIRYVKKPLDNSEEKWAYTPEQFNKLKVFWLSSVPVSTQDEYKNNLHIDLNKDKIQSIAEGRACCGGRKLSVNNSLKSHVSFVPQQGFRDWYCSVNWFFLFVRQFDGAVYTNKDCKTSTSGKVEPLGNLKDYQSILVTLKEQLDSSETPIIQCVKDICVCGFCAPKAENLKDFKELLDRNLIKEKYYGKQTL
jgi:pyruvate-formate lyase-activating enzyme